MYADVPNRSFTETIEALVLGLLILAFIALPIIELTLLLRIGGWLGVLPTLLLIVLTGTIGAALARHQGLQVIARIRQDFAAGRPPVAQVIDGALIFAAGLLLLTPGIVTDVVGITLLLPPARALVRRLLAGRMKRMIESGRAQFTVHGNIPHERSEPRPPTDGRDVSDY